MLIPLWRKDTFRQGAIARLSPASATLGCLLMYETSRIATVKEICDVTCDKQMQGEA